jgi:hypothetical protein
LLRLQKAEFFNQGRIKAASQIGIRTYSAQNELHVSPLSSHQFKRAETEFEKRMQAGEIDFRVLVAKGVNVDNAMNQMDEWPGCLFEIEFEGGASGEITMGDLYLIKRTDDVAQSMAAGNIIADFVRFNQDNGEHFSVSMEYGVFGNRIRHPTLAVFPRSHGQETLNSTVLVEVEFEPRSLQAMHAYCLAYFREPCVRAVLLVKYFPQHAANRTLFEAVAVLFRRGPRGAPAVADAVSLGTAPFTLDSLHGTLPDVGRALRVLPPTRSLRRADQWAPALRPYLTVPAADLHFLGDGAGREGAPAEAMDLTLGLWDVRRTGVPKVASRLRRPRRPGPECEPVTQPGPAPAPPAAGPPAAPPNRGRAPV